MGDEKSLVPAHPPSPSKKSQQEETNYLHSSCAVDEKTIKVICSIQQAGAQTVNRGSRSHLFRP